MVTMADGIEDDFVMHSLREMKDTGEQYGAIVGAWRKGDAAALEKIMVGEMKARMPRLYKRLVVERNRKWMAAIDPPGKTFRNRFILVGMAHLVGPEGIIEALRKRGYRVEKLKAPAAAPRSPR